MSVCGKSGCPELTYQAYCPEHAPKRVRAAGQDFYRHPDARWKAVRRLVLRRDPWCTACRAEGRFTPSAVVDHISSVADGGDRYDPANLQGMCVSCHNRKSGREGAARGGL